MARRLLPDDPLLVFLRPLSGSSGFARRRSRGVASLDPWLHTLTPIGVRRGIRSGERGARSKEQGARSKEQGARSKEQGARSKEQGAGSREQGAGSKERGARSKERGARSKERGAGSWSRRTARRLKPDEPWRRYFFFLR